MVVDIVRAIGDPVQGGRRPETHGRTRPARLPFFRYRDEMAPNEPAARIADPSVSGTATTGTRPDAGTPPSRPPRPRRIGSVEVLVGLLILLVMFRGPIATAVDDPAVRTWT